MNDDPLQLLPTERWTGLQEQFLGDWPRSVSGYTVLETQKRWLQNGISYGFEVYCPFGDVRNGMVAFNKMSQICELVIQCPRDDTTDLESALNNTKLIDWQQYITVPFSPDHIYECLFRVSLKKGCFTIEDGDGDLGFVMDINTPLYNARLPPGMTFDLLLPEHTQFVNSVWPHRYPGSELYYQFLLRNKCGFGLYHNSELITWVFINEMGNLMHLFTVEGHRRKGYSELLMKLICNEQLKLKKYVVAYCVKGNEAASKLYNKLGFVSFGRVSWRFLKPTTNEK